MKPLSVGNKTFIHMNHIPTVNHIYTHKKLINISLTTLLDHSHNFHPVESLTVPHPPKQDADRTPDGQPVLPILPVLVTQCHTLSCLPASNSAIGLKGGAVVDTWGARRHL